MNGLYFDNFCMGAGVCIGASGLVFLFEIARTLNEIATLLGLFLAPLS